MATPVYYTGDTWPPITGVAKDANGTAVDISSADSFRMVAKSGANVIAGTAAFCDPSRPRAVAATGDGTDGVWEYTWAADDLSASGTYIPELEVTWDDSSTPPKIETFRDESQSFIVRDDND